MTSFRKRVPAHSSQPSVTIIKVKKPESKLSSMKEALRLNKEIQKALLDEISKANAILEKNADKQAILKKVLDDDAAEKNAQKPPSQIRAISVFACPYFRDVKKRMPPANEDTAAKRKNKDVSAYLKPPRPWTPTENKSLLNGVTAYALSAALAPFRRQKDYLRRNLKDINITEEEMEEIKEHIELADEKIRVVSKRPLRVLLDEVSGNIDWMTVSATGMHGVRTPEECEHMWNNYLNFNINKGMFTKEEDHKLHNLVDDYKEKNWDEIASALKTNRTAIQCFERYQSKLNKNLSKKWWTKEEDTQLLNLVEQHKCGDVIPWNKISLMMEGRTRQQIINRYQRSVSQLENRGPWTPEEDAMLIACYQKFGTRWSRMGEFFQRRSTYSLRERYCNGLDPALKVGPWSNDEDRLLIAMVRRYGWGKWARICKKVPGRTDNMCLLRGTRLLEWSIKYHSDNGTGEYDPGINDPETFGRILRPCAPTKYCPIRSGRTKSYRENGVMLLAKTLQMVKPDFPIDHNNLSSLDVSWISMDVLREVSRKLHEMLLERLAGRPCFNAPIQYYARPPIRYYTRAPLQRKREESESDDEKYVQPPEIEVPKAEKRLADRALTEMFKIHSQIMQPTTRKTKVYNGREVAEMSLYKAYLYKQFHCQAKCDEYDNIDNVKFGSVDYSQTIATVLNYFIQPPVSEDEFIVLTPNCTTMLGMEVAQATENRLLDMSECVAHSKSYIDYLCERKKCSPECLQCLKKNSDDVATVVTPEVVITEMKKRSFLIDETMESSAYVEGQSSDKLATECSCQALSDSINSVRLLRKRFMALFMWPALFSETDFSQEQEHVICTTRQKDNNYFWRMNEPTTGKNARKREPKTPKCKPEKPKVKKTRNNYRRINYSADNQNLRRSSRAKTSKTIFLTESEARTSTQTIKIKNEPITDDESQPSQSKMTGNSTSDSSKKCIKNKLPPPEENNSSIALVSEEDSIRELDESTNSAFEESTNSALEESELEDSALEESELEESELEDSSLEESVNSVLEISTNSALEHSANSVLEDNTNSVLEDTTNSVLEVSAHSVLEESTNSVLEVCTNSALKEGSNSVLEEGANSVLEEGANSVLDEGTSSVLEESTNSVLEESTNSALEETTNCVLEESTNSVFEGSTHSALEESTNSALEKTTNSALEEFVSSALEESASSVLEESIGSALEDSAKRGLDESLDSAPEDIITESVTENVPSMSLAPDSVSSTLTLSEKEIFCSLPSQKRNVMDLMEEEIISELLQPVSKKNKTNIVASPNAQETSIPASSENNGIPPVPFESKTTKKKVLSASSKKNIITRSGFKKGKCGTLISLQKEVEDVSQTVKEMAKKNITYVQLTSDEHENHSAASSEAAIVNGHAAEKNIATVPPKKRTPKRLLLSSSSSEEEDTVTVPSRKRICKRLLPSSSEEEDTVTVPSRKRMCTRLPSLSSECNTGASFSSEGDSTSSSTEEKNSTLALSKRESFTVQAAENTAVWPKKSSCTVQSSLTKKKGGTPGVVISTLLVKREKKRNGALTTEKDKVSSHKEDKSS